MEWDGLFLIQVSTDEQIKDYRGIGMKKKIPSC